MISQGYALLFLRKDWMASIAVITLAEHAGWSAELCAMAGFRAHSRVNSKGAACVIFLARLDRTKAKIL
jgi:hypothetical protein